jgi:hypothetical protein
VASVGATPGAPAPPAPQNYANHVYRPLATAVAGVFTIAAFIQFVIAAIREPSALAIGLLCLASAVMTLVVISRTYTVRLQNRIIRLEMQLRLTRLGRGDAIARLSKGQITALRFASDAELPALLDRALRETLTSDQIKRAVTDWQSDDFRT